MRQSLASCTRTCGGWVDGHVVGGVVQELGAHIALNVVAVVVAPPGQRGGKALTAVSAHRLQGGGHALRETPRQAAAAWDQQVLAGCSKGTVRPHSTHSCGGAAPRLRSTRASNRSGQFKDTKACSPSAPSPPAVRHMEYSSAHIWNILPLTYGIFFRSQLQLPPATPQVSHRVEAATLAAAHPCRHSQRCCSDSDCPKSC